MISTLKQKTKYSGIKWFGDIPDTFQVTKIKFLGNLIAGGTPKTEKKEYWGGDIPWLPSGVVQNCIVSNNDEGKYITELGFKESATKEIPANSPLIALTGATCANVALLKFKATANQSVIALAVDDKNDSEFLYYSFLANREQFLINKTGGAQGGINLDNIKNTYLSIPELKLQKNISHYLNIKTEQIKKFIDNKKTLISLLEEQRQTTIYNLVTKGLDLSAKTKQSDVEWIGSIPKHWEVRRLKMLSRIIRGASPRPIDDPKYFDEDGEFSWVRISDVTASNLYLEKTEQKLSELGASLSVKQYPNDLFLSIAGSVGKPIITKIKCCIHDGFVSFSKISNELDKMFLFYILYSGEAYSGLGKEGTQLNLNIDTVGNICTPLPPLEEQKKIVKRIEEDLSKIDQAIHTVQQEIELIEEYKKSLIYQAVTGKIETLLTNK